MHVSKSRLVELIAWLSVCLLVAAWGPTLNAGLRHVWSIFGLFGLVAASGLEAVQRVRLSHERQKERKKALARYENAMGEIQRQKKVDAEVRKAAKRIAEFAAKQGGTVPEVDLEEAAGEQAATNRRSEKRTKCPLPIEILVNDAEGRCVCWAEDDSHRAYIRNISPSGIGLLHNKPIDVHRVVLRVSLENDERVSLSVCLLWCRPAKKGWFSSGGKVAEVIAAVDTLPSVPRSEPRNVSEQLAVSCRR